MYSIGKKVFAFAVAAVVPAYMSTYSVTATMLAQPALIFILHWHLLDQTNNDYTAGTEAKNFATLMVVPIAAAFSFLSIAGVSWASGGCENVSLGCRVLFFSGTFFFLGVAACLFLPYYYPGVKKSIPEKNFGQLIIFIIMLSVVLFVNFYFAGLGPETNHGWWTFIPLYVAIIHFSGEIYRLILKNL